MRKSISGFVFGLIASIAFVIWGFLSAVLGDIVSSLGGESVLITILSWLCFLGGIAGIIGASFCFKKAKVGGIVMVASTVCGSSLLIYYFVNMLKSDGNVTTSIFLCIVPVGLAIAGTVCALLAKPVQVRTSQQYGYAPQAFVPQASQPVYGPNGVILNQEVKLVDVSCPTCGSVEKFDVEKFPKSVEFNYRCQNCGTIFKVKL